MATRKSAAHNYKKMEVLLLLAFHNLQGWHHNNWRKKREKWICYSSNKKYIKGHKCAENKIFCIDCEEEEKKEQETSKEEDIHQEPTQEKEQMKPTYILM